MDDQLSLYPQREELSGHRYTATQQESLLKQGFPYVSTCPVPVIHRRFQYSQSYRFFLPLSLNLC